MKKIIIREGEGAVISMELLFMKKVSKQYFSLSTMLKNKTRAPMINGFFQFVSEIHMFSVTIIKSYCLLQW